MSVLHTSFASGTILTAGSSYGDVGTSGLNEITNRINVESGILGTLSGTMLSHTHNGTSSAVLGRPTLYKQVSSVTTLVGGSIVVISGAITTLGGGSLFINGNTSFRHLGNPSTHTGTLKLLLNDASINTATSMRSTDYTYDSDLNYTTAWLGSVAAGAHEIKLYSIIDQATTSGTFTAPTLTAFELI